MKYKLVGPCVLIVFVVYFSTNSLAIQAEADIKGKALFENKCSKCHPLSKALSKTKDLKQWQTTALRMSGKKNSGITSEEAEIIAEYLSSTGGK